MSKPTPESPPTPQAPPRPGLDAATRALIDELMSGPVKPFPQVIVVGDDAVSGFTPAPARSKP